MKYIKLPIYALLALASQASNETNQSFSKAKKTLEKHVYGIRITK